jgi:hypothetical protein
MNAEAEEKPDFFEKLADSLYSWRIEISRNKKIRSLAQWDIVLQTSENLKTATTWLEWQKGFDYAEGFKRKFQSLYNDVKNFYKKLEQGEMDEEEIFHEQIPILEDSAKKLAEYVLTVKYLCQNDRQIQEITKTEPAEAEQKATLGKWRSIWTHVKKIPRWICGLIVAVVVAIIAAIIVDILADFGWLERIKDLFTK